MGLTSHIADSALQRCGERHSFEDMRAIVSKLAEVKSRQDIEAVLQVYHPHAVLESPPFRSRRTGSDELRKGLTAFFSLVPDYAVDLPHMAIDGDTLCGWGTVHFTLSSTFTDAKPNGRRVSTPVFILFRFKEQRVSWESFHFDLSDVAEQSGVPTESLIRSRQSNAEKLKVISASAAT